MTYTWIDAVVLLILALSTLFAWSRGFVREIMGFLSWAIAVYLGWRFAGTLAPIIESWDIVKNNLNFLGCPIITLLSGVIIFIGAMIIMAILTPFASGLMRNNFLSIFDSALGAFFGFVRGLVLVLLALLVYDNLFSNAGQIKAITESASYGIFSDPKERVESELPKNDEAPNWLVRQFEVMTEHCPV